MVHPSFRANPSGTLSGWLSPSGEGQALPGFPVPVCLLPLLFHSLPGFVLQRLWDPERDAHPRCGRSVSIKCVGTLSEARANGLEVRGREQGAEEEQVSPENWPLPLGTALGKGFRRLGVGLPFLCPQPFWGRCLRWNQGRKPPIAGF